MNLVVDGRDAYAYTGGVAFDASRPCVVFVHGAANDHSVWTLHARWFAHHDHGVLAVDLPGHGRSAGPPLASVEAIARWLVALLDAAGVARAAWVGHSLGSLAALEAAAAAPDRATALVLVGTAVPMAVSDALLTAAADDPERAMKLVASWSIDGMATKPGNPGPGTWTPGAGVALMRRMQARAGDGVNLIHHDLGLCRAYAGGLAAAARVTCPATLIGGATDRMTPPRAAVAVAQALRADVVTLASGHSLAAEAPDATLAALRDALARSAASRTTPGPELKRVEPTEDAMTPNPAASTAAVDAAAAAPVAVDPKSFRSFAEFYPFYLSEHANRTCRRLHFVGSTLGLVCLAVAIVARQPWWVLVGLVAGYAFAWLGHFGFEKNRPASFKRPWYSFLGDWAMYRDVWLGRVRL